VIERFAAHLPHGITLSCRAAGRGGAPVILFLHGFPEAAFVWDDLLAHFGKRYRCVAPNLRGFADSSAPSDVQAYRAKYVVGDLQALLCQLTKRPAVVVAHDWGGAVAWGLAAAHPSLVHRLVSINAPHPATLLRELRDNPAQQAASAYMNFLCRPDAESLLAENDFARLWPFFTRMGGDAWLDDAMRERYREVWRQGLTGGCNYYRATPLRPPTGADAALMQLQLPASAVRVDVPTRVVWGDDDTALLPGLLDGLSEHVPQLQVVRVPGASHWIVHEQPARVIGEIEIALAE
jgi:pimeloyl-ACP methyl ester carboxylesterase